MDPYLDPDSGVLRNRLGITDAAELVQVEAALTGSRLIDLERRRLPGRYDLAHLQVFHRYIFGDVYDWAGELRTVTIAKGEVFPAPISAVLRRGRCSTGWPSPIGNRACRGRGSARGWRSS